MPLWEINLRIKLLTSPNVYSGNLEDPDEITRKFYAQSQSTVHLQTLMLGPSTTGAINKVAKIDRLPLSNSPEAISIIRAAWDR
jgi:hypothetical protein